MQLRYLSLIIITLSIKAVAQSDAIPPTMVLLPEGTYEMGCTSGQTPCSANNQAHLVELDSFYLSAYEIKQAQYEAVMGANPSINSGCPDCPVENVSWYDALNFCNQLSLQNNLEPCYYANPQLSQPFSGSTDPVYWYTEANGFRLPTEAEWEYAARSAGADDFAYAGSNNFNDVAWLAVGSTQAAGQLLPNSAGLYDMSGNASEWVWNYLADFTSGLACQPLGPGTGSERVRRGGSFQSAPTFKVATRESGLPESSSGQTGFRVASNNGSLLPPSLSCVANLVEPVDGASDVAAQTSISWEAVAEAEGYFLSLGTSLGGTDLLNGEDVGSTTSYSPASCLPGNTDIFVTITPYSSLGIASGCGSFTFSTGTGMPNAPSMPSGSEQVCAGDTELYTIPPVSGANNYVWAILSGGTLVSGQGTTTATVNWTGPGGQLCVLAENECGTSDFSCISVSGANISQAPNEPSGPSLACVGDTENYSILPVSGATTYNWSVEGGNILSGQGTTNISVIWTTGDGQVCVNAENQCGSSNDVCSSISEGAIPSAPGSPTGNTTVCTGATESYSIPSVSGATTYNWVVNGGNILSGQGTTNISVIWTTGGGQVCVNAENQCGSSNDACSSISEGAIPSAPGSPTGNTTVCTGATESYSIPSVSGATTYNWVVNGGNILSGQGTTNISVIWTTGGGQVCVNAENQCGSSNNACTSVNTLSQPATPNTPSGDNTVSAGDLESYSISPVPDASSYTWFIFDGIILSGQGSTNITVSWGSGFGFGEVCVEAANICGISDAICLDIVENTTPPPAMISVPSGTFDMGCTAEQTQSNCPPDEFPVHSITLSSFQISATEVTQAQWLAQVPEYDPFITSFGLGNNYPAYRISWFDAITYCNRLSQSQGLTPAYYENPIYTQVYDALDGGNGPVYWNQSANGYRLPTEAEWEYAARGAGAVPQTEFSGSNDLDAVAWYNSNSSGQSNPVTTKTPNALNTFDMTGNLWEWCWDWFSSTYYSDSPTNNPTGPTNGSDRIQRGGSWNNIAVFCRVPDRNHDSPDNRNDPRYGFRLARTP